MANRFLLVAAFLHLSLAGRIVDDYNCTYVVTSGPLAGSVVFSPLATACQDALPNESCEILFKGGSEGAVVPDSTDSSRPVNCYGFQNGPVIEVQKKIAIDACPSYCGYCCQSKNFQCQNPNPDGLDCHSITPQACMDPEQKPMLARNCPAKCGLCNYHPEDNNGGGSTDNNNGQVTEKPVPGDNGGGDEKKKNCKYLPDKSRECKTWASRGFCANPHYTEEYKKRMCSTTCKICA